MPNNKLIMVDRDDLVTKSTANAIHTLMSTGLPKEQAMTKVGIHPALVAQINKIAETYIAYYAEDGDVYKDKLTQNSPKMQQYIEACIDIHITCVSAEAEFANKLVESVMAGVEENPDLALRVLERRFADDWSPKKQIDMKVEKSSTITTIQVNQPVECVTDVEYEEVVN